MAEPTRQQKIEKLKGFVVRIKEIDEQAKELEHQRVAVQAEIDDFAVKMEMEISLREQNRESESLLDIAQARQELESLKRRRSEIHKQLEDLNAEFEWMEAQVDDIEVV